MANSTAQIAKVLNDADSNADATTAKMFLQALPHIFGGERHDFQVRLATMLRESLKQAREKQTRKQADVGNNLEEKKGEVEKRQQAKTESEALVEKAKSTAEEQAVAFSEKQEKAATSEQQYNDTKMQNEIVSKEHAELEESKNGIDSIVNGSLDMLVKSGCNEEDHDDFLKPVMEYLREMGCDQVLLAALPKSLGCCPEKRGEFAKASVEEVVKRLNTEVSRIAKALEESKTKFEEAKAEDLGAWAIADVARDAEKLAKEAKESAEAKLQEATIQDKVALSDVIEMQKEVERVLGEQSFIESKIQEIDAAVGEMDKLETEIVVETTEANKENSDMASPAAKRIKLSEDEGSAAMQDVVAPAIAVQ